MTPTGFPELTLHTNGSGLLTLSLEVAGEIQQSLFDLCGVSAPLIQHKIDKERVAETAELRLNGEPIQTLTGPETVFDIATGLREHAAELLTPKLVEHYLAVLEAKVPVLITTVRERIAVETLTSQLQDRLTKGGTINDLPGVLEELLAAASGTADPLPFPS